MEVISLKGIEKSFKNKVVLSDINISINKGEMVAIIGNSGRGKTTLLNIIGLISDKSKGDLVIYDNKNLGINTRKAMLLRREKIGYLFQNYGLVDDETVKWNLNIALDYKKISKKEKERRIDDVLMRFELQDFKNTVVYKLSGGEQQRIALARLVLQESELILADEPTGSLDTGNRNKIIDILKDLNKSGKTIIIVTHDTYVSENCTRIINL